MFDCYLNLDRYIIIRSSILRLNYHRDRKMKKHTLNRYLLLWLGLITLMSVCLLAGCSDDTTAVIPIPSPTLQVMAVPATPYANSPAAGICGGPSEGQTAKIEIWPDMPNPRCLQLSPEQYLQVTNHTDTSLQYRLGHFSGELEVGETVVLDQEVGGYLAPGVHLFMVSSYSGSELWLKD